MVMVQPVLALRRETRRSRRDVQATAAASVPQEAASASVRTRAAMVMVQPVLAE